MFAIPVKVVEISGGGGDLPQMTWNPSDSYYSGFDPEDYLFSNTNQTIEGNTIKARGNHPIVPDRWYLEMKLDSTGIVGQLGMYGFTTGTATLSGVWPGATSWIASSVSTDAVSLEGGDHSAPLVFAASESGNRLLSVDGIDALESLSDGDVLQFCGDRSEGTLWIGLNGDWLYYGIDVYDAGEDLYVLTWFPSDPETDTNPLFDDLPSSPYALCQTGEDGAGGPTPELITLRTHTDDLVYTPPTGFSVVSGDALVTYQHVLRDRNLLPIVQPTDHTLMGVLGL